MKTNLRLPILLMLFLIAAAPETRAQTLTTLHSFSGGDGAEPNGGLVLSGSTLYGTTYSGGPYGGEGYGTVFAVNTNGTSFANLYLFTDGTDGAYPAAGLTLAGNTLYGTTYEWGGTIYGSVFAVDTTNNGFTGVFDLTNYGTGAYPYAGLLLVAGKLYGTTLYGGSTANGTIFSVNTDGTGYTNLYNFTGSGDGANPNASLVMGGNILYGTASGGRSGGGTVFAVNTDGSGFTVLHAFSALNDGINDDGANPQAALTLAGNTLYGTGMSGGAFGYGTVFTLKTDGTAFSNLHNFTGGNDGADPQGSLLVSSNSLYGTATYGGNGSGTIYTLNADGSHFSTLYAFSALTSSYGISYNTDGANPKGGLLLAGNTLYGTTGTGGSGFDGTVFGLSLAVAPLAATNYLFTGISGSYYSQQLAATGGRPPYAWTVVSGSLPSGMTMTTGGLISGTPSSSGTFNFTVQATDVLSNQASDALSLTIQNPPPSPVPNGNYSASESWSVTLNLGTGNGATTKTYTGTETGTLAVTDGSYNLINHTGAASLSGINTAQTIYFYDYFDEPEYEIDGVIPPSGEIGNGGSVYLIIKLSFFVIKIPIPSSGSLPGLASEESSSFNTSGTSLADLSGTGSFIDPQAPQTTSGYINEIDVSSTARLTIPNASAPKITTQPKSQVAPVGANVVFSVTATGNPAVSYQWQQDGYPLYDEGEFSGSTGPTLTISGVTPEDAGRYTVVVANEEGSVTSANATLSIGSFLSVQTNRIGWGTIAPNYNGQFLAEGQPYTVTATPAKGFAFKNWTDANGDVLTNGAVLTFAMQSNLVLTANFADNTKPTVAITNMPASLVVGSPAFTVRGTSGDNVAVSNVSYQLNAGGWQPAVPGGTWSNWTAAVTLSVGTNVLTAYAVDTSGNTSVTVTSRVDYVVSAVLTVQTNRPQWGTITPNLNTNLLAIGRNYSLTATAAAGFKFLNWSNNLAGVVTNGAALTFAMQSNLVLTANFADNTKPTVAITNMPAGLVVGSPAFTVRGTAGDNVAVSNVWVEVGGSGWVPATPSLMWSNWTAQVALSAGTNQVRAYAVDTSGNYSLTNGASVDYVQTAPLTILTNGLGSLSPNNAGLSLRVGQNYAITATPAKGFAFVNWTNSLTGVTNHPAVTFLMQSNLVLTATFADTNRPLAAITNVPSGLTVSNALFTVKGTASDNWAVSNVWVEVGSNGWVQAAGTTGWSNWTVAVTLVPGANSIQAQAVDTSGNYSTVVSNSVKYVLSAPLTVRTNLPGWGTISPGDNGVWLQINSAYTLTAAAAAGFQFLNWSNNLVGVVTNKAGLTFAMQSNLVLTANFADVTKPTVAITNVPVGLVVGSPAFTLRGTSGDNVAVSQVWYQLNTGGWQLATPGNTWTNWTAPVTLNVGTNVLAAYAVDSSGNASVAVTNRLDYVVSAVLTVQTNEPHWGSITPNLNTNLLAIGRNYSLTATAVAGFQFLNWSNNLVGIVTNKAALTFAMRSNLVLTANFADVTKPMVAITNVPAGLVVSNAAFVVKGTAGDNAAVSSVVYSLNGSGWLPVNSNNEWSNWTAAVTLIPGANSILAQAVDTSGNVSSVASNSVKYVVSASLTVRTNLTGWGRISPSDNGALLQINSPYTLTATAAVGFKFLNWSNNFGMVTNAATLNFKMQTNLVLTASFGDSQAPWLKISAPVNGESLSNASLVVTGMATDNVSVAQVFYRTNSGSWVSASTSDAWTNWFADLSLLPGSYVLQAYAVDYGGNLSTTSSVSFTDSYVNIQRQLHGLDFSPYLDGQDGSSQVSIQQIQQRMAIVAPFTQWIRSYGSSHGLENIGPVARQFGLKTAISAYLSTNLVQNDLEISNLEQAALAGNVDLAIVGNETLLNNYLTEPQLAGYLAQVRAAIPSSIPVTTSESYEQWLTYTNLVSAVDVVMVNYYPFWEYVALSNAIPVLNGRHQQVVAAAAGKPVIVSETGWPSAGTDNGAAIPSVTNANYYLLDFVSWAVTNGVDYFYFEGFDESWKLASEGPVGPHWGIWDTNGVIKPGMVSVFSGSLLPDTWTSKLIVEGPGTPTMTLRQVPPLGSTAHLQGQALHVSWTDYAVATYIYVNGWWTKPTFTSPLTPIDITGAWDCDVTTGGNDTNATQIAAFLIPLTYTPPLLGGASALPQELYQNSVAQTNVFRSQ